MDKFILWDLDGTLVESEDIAFKTAMFNYACNKIGLKFFLEENEFIGHEAKYIFSLVLSKNKVVDIEKYLSLYNSWYEDAVTFIKMNVKEIKPRENILEIWEQCSANGIKHAVVTSSREDVARAYLQNIKLIDLCEVLVCINNVTEPKPSPVPYLTALNSLKININQCLAVEDSLSGIASATAAGIYTIAWVKNKNNADYSKADLAVEHLDFTQIQRVLNQLTIKTG